MSHTPQLAECAALLRAWIHSEQSAGPWPGGNPSSAASSQTAPAVTFETLALRLFEAQFELNAPYRQFCASRRLGPSDIQDWRQIPAVPAAAFKDLDLSCIPTAERTAVFHSSGTTEQRPSRHFHHAASLALYEASLRPWFAAHLLGPEAGGRPAPNGGACLGLLALTPPPAGAPHSSLVHMFETVRRTFGWPDSAFVGTTTADGGWVLDGDKTRAALEGAAAGGQPLMVLGTAFSFVHLLDLLTDARLKLALPRGSRLMETGGYKGRARALPKGELHGRLAQQLGVAASHIVCEYGMSELSSQAYDQAVCADNSANRPAARVFRFPPWVRLQIVSPEHGREVGEGQTGLIRVLDLANVYSVMAIQTEDLGRRRGDGFELLGRAAAAEPRGCSRMAAA